MKLKYEEYATHVKYAQYAWYALYAYIIMHMQIVICRPICNIICIQIPMLYANKYGENMLNMHWENMHNNMKTNMQPICRFICIICKICNKIQYAQYVN